MMKIKKANFINEVNPKMVRFENSGNYGKHTKANRFQRYEFVFQKYGNS